MKTLQRLCAASMLTFMLALPASAGWISTPVAPPDPSPTPAAAPANTETNVTGQEETGSSEATAADSATEAMLNLLQNVLSLL
jgi:hypothetical protein